MLSPDEAPAGTKRLSNLLRSPKWSHTLLERFLCYQGRCDPGCAAKGWGDCPGPVDESVLEKSESIALEGLGPVRSSKAARLKRIKPGYYYPPGGFARIRPRPAVDHHHASWLCWATHPDCHELVDQARPQATGRSTNLTSRLAQCSEKWGKRVIHVWDRGYAGAPWLKELTSRRLRFIMRWQTGCFLTRHAWKIAGGKRSLDHRLLWDINRSSVPKDEHRLSAGVPPPGGPSPVVGGFPLRPGTQAQVPADQRTHR